MDVVDLDLDVGAYADVDEPTLRDAVKGLHGTSLHGSVLRIEISANNKNKLGPRGGYRERKELSYDGRASTRCLPARTRSLIIEIRGNLSYP